MLNKWDLQRHESSLDQLISAISSALNEQRKNTKPASGKLVREMQEALDELRQKRGVHRLLVAIEESRTALRKTGRRTSH